MMNYPKSFIARHIRFVNDDVIEVKRYLPHHKYRSPFIALSLSLLVFVLSYVVLSYWLGYGDMYNTISDIKWFLIAAVLLFFIGKCIPNPRPVRFDKKRKLIYLWEKNRLWIKHYPEQALKTKSSLSHTLPIRQDFEVGVSYVNHYEHKFTIHYLKLDLEDTPIKREYFDGIQIGLFNNKEKNRQLLEFIVDFLRSKDNEEIKPYKNLKNYNILDHLWFLGICTLKYDEDKTEKAIQAWLDNHSPQRKYKSKYFKKYRN